jgi:SAM-dependent methyltransferase
VKSTEGMLRRIIADFEKYLAADTNTTMQARSKAGEYHFIPLDLNKFREQLERGRMAAMMNRGRSKDPLKFIDVGCGIGTKVLAAQSLSDYDYGTVHAYGIEKEARYVGVARGLLSAAFDGEEKAKERIILGNALRYDYGSFDIIYFYRPLCNPELQLKLEERILSTSKKGTIILANGAQSPELGWNPDGKPNKLVRDLCGDRNIFLRV